MARLQILELPEGSGDDRPPFVLVVDQYEPAEATPSRLFRHQDMAEQIGARAVLAFEETIDIPANDLTLSHVQEAADGNIVRLRVEPDLEGFTETVMAEATSTQTKAAEAAGQKQDGRKAAITDALGIDRTRDWGDIRNAAAGIRRSRDSMRDAIERVRNLSDEPEIMDAQHPHPAAYLHGYRIAMRDAKRATREPETTDG